MDQPIPARTTRPWTTEQGHVISATTQTLLVNAGAGTGKTASLIERLLTLIDREPNSPDPQERPASLQQMVVVTFTNAAAREMKERLAKSLRERADFYHATHRDSDRLRHLKSELSLLPRATISTLHSFCITLLREYGHLIALAPDFDVMNEEEALLLRNELLDERLEDWAGIPQSRAQLQRLLRGLNPAAGVQAIKKEIRTLHHFLEALSNPEAFLEQSLKPYAEAADESIPLLQTQVVRGVLEDAEAALAEYEQRLSSITAGIARGELSGVMSKYAATCDGLVEQIAALRLQIAQTGIIPDFRCLKPANKPQERSAKTGSDFEIITRAILIKESYDALNLVTDKQDISLQILRDQAASHLAPLQFLLITAGLELSNEFQAQCRLSNRLTFNQLERLTLNLLDAHTEVSTLLRRTYEHVFVDEFQDISGLQGRLLELIARQNNEARGEAGNLFAVGDVKQSIYGFRQADPRQFLARLSAYKAFNPYAPQHPGSRLDLVQNFRSTPPLLRLLNGLFERLFSPTIGGIAFDDSHAFVPGKAEPKELHHPTLEVLILNDSAATEDEPEDADASDLTESEVETDALAELALDQGAKEARHVARCILDLKRPFRDVAILLRSAKGNATKLVAELRNAGIPFQTSESIGFLAQQEVNDLLCALHTINSPYQDVELIGLLRGPLFGWSADELVQLRLVNMRGRLADNLRQSQTLAPGAPGEKIRPRAKAVLEKLAHWQTCSVQESVSDFINRLYRDGALVECYGAMSNGEQRVRNLQYFQERATQYDRFARRGLAGFLEFVESLLAEDKDLGKPPVVAADEDAVHLMTMHKSKGLEFPVVICPFMGKRFNLQDLRNRLLLDRDGGVGISLAPLPEFAALGNSLPFHKPLKLTIKRRFLSEELRLLYVALTRAEERLILTGVKAKWLEKLAEPERFALPELEERGKAVEKAGCFLDWILMGFGNSPEFAQLSESVQESTANAEGLILSWKHLTEQLPEVEPANAEKDEAASDAGFALELKRLLDWENRAKDPVLRAKISATEAKRERETLHHAYLAPAHVRPPSQRPALGAPRTVGPKKLEAEEWLPPFFRDELLQKKTRITGAEKGKIVHRFLALVNLEALAKGVSLEQEWARLESEKFFQPEEKHALWFPALHTLFYETEIGQKLLAYPSYVQRELAFTASVPVSVFGVQGDDCVLLQGMVDALILVPEGIKGGPLRVLVDFKTDYWDGTAGHFDSLTSAYKPQLLLYQYGLELSMNQRIDQCCLYFLAADQPFTVPSPKTDAEWHAFLKQTLQEAVSRRENVGLGLTTSSTLPTV